MPNRRKLDAAVLAFVKEQEAPDDTAAKIRAALDDGWTMTEVARAFGVTKGAVSKRLADGTAATRKARAHVALNALAKAKGYTSHAAMLRAQEMGDVRAPVGR